MNTPITGTGYVAPVTESCCTDCETTAFGADRSPGRLRNLWKSKRANIAGYTYRAVWREPGENVRICREGRNVDPECGTENDDGAHPRGG